VYDLHEVVRRDSPGERALEAVPALRLATIASIDEWSRFARPVSRKPG
jgi:hypothetical protein